jgi:hypothetical protein
MRERAATWILRTVYDFAAKKSLVPGRMLFSVKNDPPTGCDAATKISDFCPGKRMILAPEGPH